VIGKFGPFEFALSQRYRLEEIVGRGAMGTVYRAMDVRIERPVALKMLHPILTTEIGIRRFQSEIRIAGNLQHPNIVAVFDSGEVDGYLYYVMPFVAGQSLRARLADRGVLSIADAVSITCHVAAGLQYAHDQRVIHRDIKPENILLSNGGALLADFGLARLIDESVSERLTESGYIIGTPHYLSPEQAAGDKEVTPMADQYALACVLFEMLSGQPPFPGPSAAAIAMRHVSDEAPSLMGLRPDLPAGLAEAVSRAMRKPAAERHAGVREFASAASVALRVSDVQPTGQDEHSLLASLKARLSAAMRPR
jgi:serine/threonine-protein kinase